MEYLVLHPRNVILFVTAVALSALVISRVRYWRRYGRALARERDNPDGRLIDAAEKRWRASRA